MQVEIDDFFKPLKFKPLPVGIDYSKAEYYIQGASAFARAVHQCVYVIDYYKRGFIYVSDNPLFLCGETPADVLKMGYQFYQKHVPPADLNMLLQINEAGFDFYYNLPPFERLKYSISYDFHLIQPAKRHILVNHKLTPLALDNEQNIWLALCVVTHSAATKAGNINITKMGSNKLFEYNRISKKWDAQKKIKLSNQEKEILTLTIQGFTMGEIAKKLKIVEVTVKFHKKNIFKKLKVNNITEAVASATNCNLFE